jgi:hypothetical protein
MLGLGRTKAYELIAGGELQVVHIGRAHGSRSWPCLHRSGTNPIGPSQLARSCL